MAASRRRLGRGGGRCRGTNSCSAFLTFICLCSAVIRAVVASPVDTTTSSTVVYQTTVLSPQGLELQHRVDVTAGDIEFVAHVSNGCFFGIGLPDPDGHTSMTDSDTVWGFYNHSNTSFVLEDLYSGRGHLYNLEDGLMSDYFQPRRDESQDVTLIEATYLAGEGFDMRWKRRLVTGDANNEDRDISLTVPMKVAWVLILNNPGHHRNCENTPLPPAPTPEKDVLWDL